MAAVKKKQDEKNLKLLRDLAGLPHNKKCFDCGQRGPTYVNTTIGSFVCTSCSGILRGLNPPHRVKSISMTSFTPQEIESLQGQGNEFCKKVWLGLWNSSMPAEPETRDEQKIKDFMAQKYERKRWYIPPQQVTANSTTQSAPEPKPLKQLLGENAPTVTVQVSLQAQATRERPRTGSQTNSSSVPVSVAPPPGQAQPVAQPAPQPVPQVKPPSVDLLGDLGGDPFAQQQQGQFGSPPQQGGFGSFDAFGAPPSTAPAQNTFDPFGSSAPYHPVQQTQSGFAAFGASPQQQQQQQQQQDVTQQQQQPNFFDAFGSPPASSGGFNAFASQTSTVPSQPSAASNSGFGPLVSASGGSVSTGDKYAALSELDNLFGPSTGGSSNSSISSASGFGSTGTSSFGMSSGPNPFSSTTSGTGTGGFQQAQQQPSNPFQGLGGHVNGPSRSMSPGSGMQSTTGTGGGFGNFSSAQPMASTFGNQSATSGFGAQPSNTPFSGSSQLAGGFGSFASAQQSSFGGTQQPSWGGMSGQQQMGRAQNTGMPSSSPQQNLGFGGAGMTAMAWTQFGKMGGGGQQQQQQPQMQSQMNFGGNQPGFGGNQAFGGTQPNAGFASLGSGFGSNPMSNASGFGGQQQGGGFGSSGSFGGQLSSGFGNQSGAASFGGGMSTMGVGQFGQQQMQQFGSWQQSQQANPFMNAGPQGMQRPGQSTNPFM